MIIYYLAPSLQAKVPPRQSKWNQKNTFNMINQNFGIMKEKESMFLNHRTDSIQLTIYAVSSICTWFRKTVVTSCGQNLTKQIHFTLEQGYDSCISVRKIYKREGNKKPPAIYPVAPLHCTAPPLEFLSPNGFFCQEKGTLGGVSAGSYRRAPIKDADSCTESKIAEQAFAHNSKHLIDYS